MNFGTKNKFGYNVQTFERFKVGDFECVSLSDGGLNYPVASLFKDVPLERAEAILREFGLPTTHVYLPYTLLYVDTSAHRVLVDLGVGRYGELAKKFMAPVDNSALSPGIVSRNIHAAGMRLDAIDTVIITHAHGDHVGGQGELNLPNAQYFMWRAEWDYWFSDEAATKQPPTFIEMARLIELLRERMTFVEPGDEIVPGITAIATPGHTPGHLALSIKSNGEELLHLSDAIIHPVHLAYPDILLQFDILPELTIVSRRHICERAATSKALVFGHHLPPFPNVGHIVQKGESWRWQPYHGQ